MATHSSVLAWRILGTGDPDGLPYMGSHRVGHDWSDLAAAAVAADRNPCILPIYNSPFLSLWYFNTQKILNLIYIYLSIFCLNINALIVGVSFPTSSKIVILWYLTW